MKKFYIFAFVAMFFAACATDPTADVQPIDASETLTVSFEEDTRIQLNEAQKTVWNEGDLVSVFYLSNANQKWQFQGKTGDRTGTLKRVMNVEATQEMSSTVVVYPYNESYYINPRTCNVRASLPATQHYLKDSYGLDGNIMISSSEYNQFSLKNVCGWLKLQITGNGEKVKSITLKGNNGEQVAGQIYINSADATATLASEMGVADDNENGVGGNLVFDETIFTEVTLDCGEGVTLGSEATAFYIALPPQTFEKGLTAVVETTNGEKMTKKTYNSLEIERNTIQPMAALELELDMPSNEIWYTSSDGKIVTPNKTDAFGVSIKSNTYENGKGVITFNGNVTSIGEFAFYERSSLTSVTIGNSVTSIGKSAFYNCSSLTSVTIPDSVTSIGQAAFSYCSSLTSVTIPNSVTSIGRNAFYDCSSLTSVTIPDSVTSIGERAFSRCSSLTAFYGKFASADNSCLIVDGVLESFAIDCGATSYSIPDSVTSIRAYAFYKCSSLTSVNIPDSVTSIGSYAFYGCSSLASITIPDSVTSIGDFAFAGCSSLTSVTIGNSVTCIDQGAFSGCSSLTSVTIGNSVTDILPNAFSECSSLTSVHISDLSAWCKICFYSDNANPLYYANNLYLNGNLVTELTIPSDVSVIMPIAFDTCTSLTSVTIPDSVTEIGLGAFYRCESLTSVYCKATTPPTGANYMFYGNASGRKIYVPASDDDSIINAYKAAQCWSDYANDIEEYDFSAEQ